MTRILLHGTGGVGGIYAYILHKGGANVTAVCRSNYDAVSRNGIKISSKVFGEVSVKPLRAAAVQARVSPDEAVNLMRSD